MRKLTVALSLLFAFSIAGNAMAVHTKTVHSQSLHVLSEISKDLTYLAGRKVTAGTADKTFEIESVRIKALGDSVTVIIKGQTKIRGEMIELSISATAATSEKALDMAFNGVEAIREGGEEKN